MSQHTKTRNAPRWVALVFLLGCAAAAQGQTNSYTQVNLASDIAGMANTVDPDMINPWGLARLNGMGDAGSSWYLADNGTGWVSDVSQYGFFADAFQILPASGQGKGVPAGACTLEGALYFTTLDGTLQWDDYVIGPILLNNSGKGAVYTACTQWHTAEYGPETLYLANSAGGVEAYDNNFDPISLPPGAFTDANIPAGFTPYGMYTAGARIQGGPIWVSFFNGTPGAGQGYVDAFDENGNLLLSLEHGIWMDQPYGITQAPASGFGAFNNGILVAMTGSGMIAVFNPTTGKFSGVLKNSAGQYLVNSGIHGLGFGGGNIYSGTINTLYFTAGIDNFLHGLFGAITAN
jgi:uncharacterized protein (TIGR03118 family)